MSTTPTSATLDSLASIYRLILPEFRGRFIAIVGLAFAVAFLEVMGVASVLPLIALMVNPEIVERSQFATALLRGLGTGGVLPPIHVFGLFIVCLFMFTNAVTLLLNWWSTKFSAQLAVALSERLARAHFSRPFTFFMAHPPAELAHKICSEVSQIASGGVLQLCFVIVRLVTLLVVLMLLLVLSPLFSVVFFSVTVLLYVLSYRFSANRLASLGTKAMSAASGAVGAASEMYSVAREILLRGNSHFFISRVASKLQESQQSEAFSRILPTLPKYALEMAAVLAIFTVPIYRSYQGQDVSADLPILATFAYAGFRLLPITQQFYAALATLKYYVPIAKEMERILAWAYNHPGDVPRLAHMPSSIGFHDVGYAYPNGVSAAVSHISFTIKRSERVALVGDSGAGKSTVVDIVLGLLSPSTGQIFIDDEACKAGLAWMPGTVGYVPQAPLILDDSIARNIAFGVGDSGVDVDRCRAAARKAGILDVIEKLPKGMDTIIGGDGINFSGGERQRLMIARAFYQEPEFLVLDEPGSALDPPTSRKIFELLCSPQVDATVLVVTHDVEHLPLFDKIVFLRDGAVVQVGSYGDLMARCDAFREFQGALAERQSHSP